MARKSAVLCHGTVLCVCVLMQYCHNWPSRTKRTTHAQADLSASPHP